MPYILLFFSLMAITTIGTHYYCAFAKRFQLLDKPDAVRKLQKQPIPVGGGAVVHLVFLLTFLGTCFWPSSFLSVSGYLLYPLMVTSTILVVTGLWDDRNGMNGKVKLAIQTFLSIIITILAKDYSQISLFGCSCELGLLFYPIAIFWVIGFINSINLLDGADGVVTSLGIYIFITIGLISLINPECDVFPIAFVLTAGLCGFFLCNKPPAKVYLGDTGSMMIGFAAGILVLRACTVNQSIRVIPAICVVSIPLLDSCFAIIRRKNAMRSIFSTDRGHIHHRIQKKFGRNFVLLGILSLLQLPLCVAAIAGIYYQNDWIPLVVMILFLGLIVSTGIFGRAELTILWVRGRAALSSRFCRESSENQGLIFMNEGEIPWTELWSKLLEQVKATPCVSFQLDLTMPFLHEDYYGEWKSLARFVPQTMNFAIPLVVKERRVGMLYVKYDQQKISLYDASLLTDRLCQECCQDILERIDSLG